jgi:hypothetical protein
MGATQESLEKAEHIEHAIGHNKQIALLIAVIALFLALSETLGNLWIAHSAGEAGDGHLGFVGWDGVRLLLQGFPARIFPQADTRRPRAR